MLGAYACRSRSMAIPPESDGRLWHEAAQLVRRSSVGDAPCQPPPDLAERALDKSMGGMGDEHRGEQHAREHRQAVAEMELIEEDDGHKRVPEIESV